MAGIYVSTKVDSYQQQPNSSGKLSKAGWVRLRGRERYGWRDRAYRDVFTASSATGPAPPSFSSPAFDVDVDVDSAGAGLQALQNKPHPLPR